MRCRNCLVVSLFVVLASAGIGRAAPIPVTFLGSFLEGQPGVDQGLPIYLAGDPNNVRFKFFVPDYASLASLDSMDVTVGLYDDGDNPNTEEGDVLLVLNGAGLNNVTLGSFAGLNGYTDASPFTWAGSVAAGDLGNVVVEIQADGILFIRVNRNSQDFYVHGVGVTLDGAMIPEPATVLLLGGGLVAGLLLRRRHC